MSSAMVLSDIESSNIPNHRKSMIRQWYDRLSTGVNAVDGISARVREGGHAIRQGGEGLIMGALLGFVEAERGSLDIGKIPIDGVLAGIGLAASVYMANDPYGISADMRNMGASCLTILSYRKTKAWRETNRAEQAHASVMHHGIDPIEAAAKDLFEVEAA